MKSAFIFIVCSMLFQAATAFACTDPSTKKAVMSADEATIVYEYFRPAKFQDKKKPARTITELADSLLANARTKHEAQANRTSSDAARISAELKGTPKEYRERAELELFRIKSWADSICNAFRRGSYKIGPEDAPR
jgi:hypothetical protein